MRIAAAASFNRKLMLEAKRLFDPAEFDDAEPAPAAL
jgi:hypothetical protein